MRQTNNAKGENGRWSNDYIAEVLGYADAHSNAMAIRKYNIPPTTFYGWKRRSEFQKPKR